MTSDYDYITSSLHLVRSRSNRLLILLHHPSIPDSGPVPLTRSQSYQMLAWIKEWLLSDIWLLPSFFSFCFALPLSNYPLIMFHNAKKQPRYPNEEGSAWFLYHCVLAYDRGCFFEYICLNSLFRSWIHRFMHVSKRPFMLDFVSFFFFFKFTKK